MNNPSTHLSIGTLSQRTGLATSAIRYYENIGLIPKATRRLTGHRVYTEQSEELLRLIRHCREFGFSVEDTKALVSLASSQARDCAEARDIAQVHLDMVRSKLVELRALEHSLGKFVAACNEQCAGGPAPSCTILKDLTVKESGFAVGPNIKPRARCCG